MSTKKTDQESEVIPAKTKTCFVMMPIADHPDYEPAHFNRVYQYLIKPACIKAGYQPIRADDNKASNMIMFDILKKIVECDMAICDLSSRNANVFYELGLRQAFNKKTILITDNRLPAPFDISAFRYVPYSHTLRVDTVDREIPGIMNMLKETENLPADDVNSIIKLLQIQPSKVENIDLNKEDSVMYSMLMNIQKQIAEIKSPSLKLQHRYVGTLTNTKRANEITDLTGLNFNAVRHSFPHQLFSHEFMFDDKYLGFLYSIGEGEVTFSQEGDLTVYPDDPEILGKIYVI